MTLEYYSYSCFFRNTNIFRYSFGKYVASKKIRIFILYIIWHPNIFGYLFVSILWYSLITDGNLGSVDRNLGPVIGNLGATKKQQFAVIIYQASFHQVKGGPMLFLLTFCNLWRHLHMFLFILELGIERRKKLCRNNCFANLIMRSQNCEKNG